LESGKLTLLGISGGIEETVSKGSAVIKGGGVSKSHPGFQNNQDGPKGEQKCNSSGKSLLASDISKGRREKTGTRL